MKNEPFYRLIPRNGMMKTLNKVKSLKSINRLSELIAFAEIDKSLFDLLQQPKVRTVFINFIIEEYFPEFKNTKNQFSNFYETQIETEILKENKTSYISKLEIIKSEMDNDAFEQEVFIRGGIFKKTIPKIYNYSCCITGFKVNTNYNIQMIDACHIIPFSISQDDTIQNGISLSPNIHRAFDRGLITINQDYIIRVSPSINKSSSTSEITELDGKSIILPQDPRHYPSLEALEWHRKEVFLF
ncbi:HNH endonuclease [Nonlabens tegetincola]|uniref:HNH endonuclease n=1 Tax=Nonlabens tegetincola TaxID=323273 RepID=UPI001FD5648B|nr:HNH endonuclease [Nonlabens tegetincola]